MTASRVMPPVFMTPRRTELTAVAGVMLVSLVLLAFGLLALRDDPRSALAAVPWYTAACSVVVFLGLCFVYPLFLIGAVLSEMMDGIGNANKRREWKRNAIRVEVPIVDRKEEYNDYAECREEQWDCELALRLPWDMPNQPAGQVFWLKVDEPIFDRYSKLNMAIIHRSASDPCMFILEGE